MDVARPVSCEVSSVAFSFYSPDEIKSLSVKQITNPIAFDSLDHPNRNGLYDPALGPLDRDSGLCGTCGLNYHQCPGHVGHIQLPVVCYNPLTFRLMFKLLQSMCMYCHHFRSSRIAVRTIAAKLKLVRAGLVVEALDLDAHVASQTAQSRGDSDETDTKTKKKGGRKGSSMVSDEAAEEGDDGMEVDGDGEDWTWEDSAPSKTTGRSSVNVQQITNDVVAIIDEYVEKCFSRAAKRQRSQTKQNGYDSDDDNKNDSEGSDDEASADYQPATRAKHTQITELVRKLEKSFLSSIPPQSCANCRGQNARFRAEGMQKIFFKGLSATQAKSMRTKGKVMEDVFKIPIVDGHAPAKTKDDKPRTDYPSAPGDDVDNADAALMAKYQDALAARLANSKALLQSFEEARAQEKTATNGADSSTTTIEATSQRYLTSEEIYRHFLVLWSREREILDLLYGAAPPPKRFISLASASKTDDLDLKRVSSQDMFFVQVLPVPPNRFRPPDRSNGRLYEAGQNVFLTQVLKATQRILDLQREAVATQEKITKLQTEVNSNTRQSLPSSSSSATADPATQLQNAEKHLQTNLKLTVEGCIELQKAVNGLFDSSQSSSMDVKAQGIRQLLEKKEGLFRKHMMGKRVNYACRSVISPDPYIETNEIGIPPVFARKLTFPEPVTHHNVTELRQLVINGPYQWPGATHVQQEDGILVDLSLFDEAGRTAIANQLLTPTIGSGASGSGGVNGGMVGADGQTSYVNKKVYRHLRNGDFLLLNRQPTLHKPSIMAHTARVLPGEKTIRMHYANCNTYNADFDGDEMNAHFPQNHIARAEAMLIARTDEQYLVPTDGGVLRGLIQDHVVAGVDMTSRDTFLGREEYMQLVYVALRPEGGLAGGAGGLRASSSSSGNTGGPSTTEEASAPAVKGVGAATSPPSVRTKPSASSSGTSPDGASETTGDDENMDEDEEDNGRSGSGSGRSGGIAMRHLGNGNVEPEVVIGDNGKILVLPPAILKPVPLWTGKQVISTILLNLTYTYHKLNLTSKSRIPAKSWGPTAPEEATVLIRDGELLTGILDKSQFGASAHGLVHAVYEIYGPPFAARLLSMLGRLFTHYMQIAGFSCRMDDLMLNEEGDRRRSELLKESLTVGKTVAKEYVGLAGEDGQPVPDTEETNDALRLGMERVLRNDEKMAGLDSAFKSATNRLTSSIISSCIPDTLVKPFPYNNMQVMTVSGAKGSAVNVSQISCLLGQQELEGRRVPTMVSGKTLPSFVAFDPSAKAGGYITGRFLTGIKPSEYFFHCMAGREGLIDTAVKTSRSGYLQRCLIKGLEGLHVAYDGTVRDSDGSVIQFRYGEDALDVVKQKTLDKFGFCAMNYLALVARYRPGLIIGRVDDKAAGKYREKQEREERKIVKRRKSGVDDSARGKRKYADPVLSKFHPERYIGSTSDSFAEALEKYIQTNPDSLIYSEAPTDPSVRVLTPEKFKLLMQLKYQNSVSQAGEAVGLVAAQSIGEPSTQMTLNTFHFAGFGAKNVTLGIPRLREIIMTASTSIKTPMMRLPLLPHASKSEGDHLARKLSKLVVSDIMTGITLTEKFTGIDPGTQLRSKEVTVRLRFWPRKTYYGVHKLTPEELSRTMEVRFVPMLERAIQREFKGRVRGGKEQGGEEEIGVGVKVTQGVGAADGDELAVASKKKKKTTAGVSDKGENAAADEDLFAMGSSKKRGKRGNDSDDEDDEQNGINELDGDEDEGGEDGDATNAKVSRNRAQLSTYDGPDEDDEEIIREVDAAMGSDDEDDEDEDGENGDGEDGEGNEDGVAEDGTTREERIVSSSKFVVGYRFDRKKSQWCEITMRFSADAKKLLMVALSEQVSRSCVIREVKGIQKSYIVPNEAENDKSINLTTEGVNLKAIWDPTLVSTPSTNAAATSSSSPTPLVDLNNIYTNDISAVLKTYGVEAARATIVKEVAGVFGVYGISVDPRHLGLIADYMTFEGGYKAFNRIGMNSNPAPFAQMSFETTTQFLTAATVSGDIDTLQSPSSRLVLGKVVSNGTGIFEVAQPLM
ncbi:hypothetical protein HK102_003478 [Quaeritorhiza haematococci]|nr:hypothetical protein HK102_003478 [Quaeritorhiza haematococci]